MLWQLPHAARATKRRPSNWTPFSVASNLMDRATPWLPLNHHPLLVCRSAWERPLVSLWIQIIITMMHHMYHKLKPPEDPVLRGESQMLTDAQC